MHICHVSTFSPTPCGIATYTEALISSSCNARHSRLRLAYHCDDPHPDVEWEIRIESREAYSAAARAINASDVELVSLQHEFGIFGGRNGDYVTEFVNHLQRPLVTTLHTTPALMIAEQSAIVKALVQHSDAVVVLSEQARENIRSLIRDNDNVSVVRHGVPDVRFEYPESKSWRKQWARKHVFFSAGHVSDRKGYTNTLAALAALRGTTDDFAYVIVGDYQPQFGSNSQCISSLRQMSIDYGLHEHVFFYDRYVPLDVLLDLISSSDIGIVAYTDCQQSSSGMVPMMLACGRPVIATPFEYARSSSRVMPGLHVCGGYQSTDILDALLKTISEKDRLRNSMPTIYAAMRRWVWPNAARAYAGVFEQAYINFQEANVA